MPDLLTPREASRIVPLSQTHIMRLARRLKVKAEFELHTGRILIDVGSLEGYLASAPKRGIKKGQVLNRPLQWPALAILDHLRLHGPKTRPELVTHEIGLERWRIDRVVRRLHLLDLVEPCGAGRPERWRLTDAGLDASLGRRL